MSFPLGTGFGTMQGWGTRLVWLLALTWLCLVLGGEGEDGEVVVEEEDEALSDELGEEDGVLVLHEHNFARALSEHGLLLVEFCKCPRCGQGCRQGCGVQGRGAGAEWGTGWVQDGGWVVWAGTRLWFRGAQGMACDRAGVWGVGWRQGLGAGTQAEGWWGTCSRDGGDTWRVCGTWALVQGIWAGARAGAQQAHVAILCPSHPLSPPWEPGTPQSCPGAVPTANTVRCPQTRRGAGTASGWPRPLPRRPPR